MNINLWTCCLACCLSLGLAACTQTCETEKVALQQQIDTLTAEVRQLRNDRAQLLEVLGEPLSVGFEVQIGAFEYFDIHAYSEELVRFREIDQQGMKKYVLGRFRTYEDAAVFRDDLRRLGLGDAFIAGVVDGQRTDITAAQAAAVAYYGE
ncbi:MAG: hypothetical protein OHK0039_20220 [Bacteroidia bacterium]